MNILKEYSWCKDTFQYLLNSCCARGVWGNCWFDDDLCIAAVYDPHILKCIERLLA